jgi:hypothetical protein
MLESISVKPASHASASTALGLLMDGSLVGRVNVLALPVEAAGPHGDHLT